MSDPTPTRAIATGYFKRPGVTLLVASLFFFYLGHGVLLMSGPDSFLLAVCRRTLNDDTLPETSRACQTNEIHALVATYGGRVRTVSSVLGLLIKIHIYKWSDRVGRKPVIVGSIAAVWLAYLCQWLFTEYCSYVSLAWWVLPNIVFCTHFLLDFFLIYLADVASAQKGKRSLQDLATDVSFFYAFILFLGALVGPALANIVAENAVGSSVSDLNKLGLILVFAGLCCVTMILPESTTPESRERAKVKWEAESHTNSQPLKRAKQFVDFKAPVQAVVDMAQSQLDKRNARYILGYLSLYALYGTFQYTGFLFYKRQWGWGMEEITMLNVEVTIILIASQVFLGPLFVSKAEAWFAAASTSSMPVALLGCKLQTIMTFGVGLIQLLFSTSSVVAITNLVSGVAGTFISSVIALQMSLGPPESMSTIMGGIGVARSVISIPSETIISYLFVSALSAPRLFLATFLVIDSISLALLYLVRIPTTGAIQLQP